MKGHKAQTVAAIRRALLRALSESVLPWARDDGVERLILAHFPLQAPPDVQITPHAGPPLQEDAKEGKSASYVHLTRWPDEALHTIRVPYLACVISGEADLSLGVTPQMQSTLGAAAPSSGAPAQSTLCGEATRYELALPCRTFLLIPPRVPHSDGSRAHWERARPETARSKIFWLHAFPSGIVCHTCITAGLTHTPQPRLFVQDAQAGALMELLIEELRERAYNTRGIAHSLLLALLLRVERDLKTGHAIAVDDMAPRWIPPDNLSPVSISPAGAAPDSFEAPAEVNPVEVNPVVERACHYIRVHLHQPLDPALIARHAHASPSHLNRLFQAELQMPVMRFVTQCRIEEAKALLADTDLPIHEIHRLIGYRDASHFCRVFTQWTAMPPRRFRRHKKLGATHPIS